MPKYGVSIKINVLKLDKARFFKGEKGTYADLTVFIDPNNPNEYGNNGLVRQSTKKEENVDMPILGSAKVFWQEQKSKPNQENQGQTEQAQVRDDPTPF